MLLTNSRLIEKEYFLNSKINTIKQGFYEDKVSKQSNLFDNDENTNNENSNLLQMKNGTKKNFYEEFKSLDLHL